jgi:hypothetical protein
MTYRHTAPEFPEPSCAKEVRGVLTEGLPQLTVDIAVHADSCTVTVRLDAAVEWLRLEFAGFSVEINSVNGFVVTAEPDDVLDRFRELAAGFPITDVQGGGLEVRATIDELLDSLMYEIAATLSAAGFTATSTTTDDGPTFNGHRVEVICPT